MRGQRRHDETKEIPRPAMATELLPTRTAARKRFSRESLRRSFGFALALHLMLLAGLVFWSLIHFRTEKKFGSANPLAGAVQASMVHALPLPPRQPAVEKSVLASEKPNIAPPPPSPRVPQPRSAPPPKAEKAKPEPLPRRDSVPLNKPTADKPARTPAKAEARSVTPELKPDTRPAPTHPQPAPPTPKATSGETGGLQLPQSTTELRNGTATITVEERAFGERYAYYIRLISQKVNQSRSSEDADPPDARGKRTVIRFTIDRDGTPIEAEVQTRSGSAALDRSALRSIQRIDTFGPLPAGDHLTVDFGFTDR